MRNALIGYVVIAVLVWPVITGMLFHDVQAIHLAPRSRGNYSVEELVELRNENLGATMVFGAFFAAGWPVLLPAAFCITGFAQHGVWIQK